MTDPFTTQDANKNAAKLTTNHPAYGEQWHPQEQRTEPPAPSRLVYVVMIFAALVFVGLLGRFVYIVLQMNGWL